MIYINLIQFINSADECLFVFKELIHRIPKIVGVLLLCYHADVSLDALKCCILLFRENLVAARLINRLRILLLSFAHEHVEQATPHTLLFPILSFAVHNYDKGRGTSHPVLIDLLFHLFACPVFQECPIWEIIGKAGKLVAKQRTTF